MVNYGGGSANITVTPSGDTTGVTDAARLTAAVARIPAKGGVVALEPSGPWYIAAGSFQVIRSGVYLNAPGVFINGVGTGDVIYMHDQNSGGTWPVYGGGILGYPVIDGSNMGAGSRGVNMGDLFQGVAEVFVQNIPGAGSIGAYFPNLFFWTEQFRCRVFATNCTAHVVFDVAGATTSTESFARLNGEFYVDQVTPSYDGVVLQNGADIYDGSFVLRGNWAGSASALTSCALRLTGTVPVGHPGAGNFSLIQQSHVDIQIECGTGANTPTTMLRGNSNNKILGCYGVMDFNQNFTPAAGAGIIYPFNGYVKGDATLATGSGYPFGYTWNISGGLSLGDFSGASSVATSGTINTVGKSVSKVTTAGNVTGVILQSGGSNFDGQQVWVINESANTITFAAAGTSHVADGVSDVIAATSARLYVWDINTSLWYKAS